MRAVSTPLPINACLKTQSGCTFPRIPHAAFILIKRLSEIQTALCYALLFFCLSGFLSGQAGLYDI
ncbi:hypothetical protein HMPREF9370_0660 [Neisseria wadsworthii 9715]|uniref:Uncharacterized protein n=1 Tax=Neisseria wadsworthii 9715 TaxID=1030841 RepID=G4CNK1_9NEIS|nr:hypothetical protein HMPREF9370_0660 [Neisseria wadsworthii 9715]